MTRAPHSEGQSRQPAGTYRDTRRFGAPHAAIGRQHDVTRKRVTPRVHKLRKIDAANFLFRLEEETEVERRFLASQKERLSREDRQQHRRLVVTNAAAVET